MMKKHLLLFLVFALSLSFSQLIDYEYTHHMGPMRQYLQSEQLYLTEQDVRYHLETRLSIPFAERDRWLAGSGSYLNIREGDVVCEGLFNYQSSAGAQVDMGTFNGVIVSISGEGSPANWPGCTGACPAGNAPVWWTSNIHYGSPADKLGKSYSDGMYHLRRVSYQEVWGAQIYTNKRAEVATMLSGSARLSYAKSGGFSPLTTIYNTNPLTGSQPSSSGSFTVNVPSGQSGGYAFTQRMDVTGGMIVAYNLATQSERFFSYTSLVPPSPQSKYTFSNIQRSSTITIVSDDEVGIIPPSILFVDMGSDGIVMGEDPYEVTPGESVPVTIKMFIPNCPSDYYALTFEFFDVTVNAPPGATFTVTSGINQCSLPGIFQKLRNGGWTVPPSVQYPDIIGTYNVPEGVAPGEYTVNFCVHWRSCPGEQDCSGNGDSGIVCRPVEIMIPSGDLPDLVCTVEPITYVDGISPGPNGFGPGEGVESWRVTVTNQGQGDFNVLNSYESFFCSMMMFQAYSSDNSPSLSSPYLEALVSNYPGTIGAGESRVFEIDAEAVCIPGQGDAILAGAMVNFLGYSSTAMNPVMPACVPHYIQESNPLNNMCSWTGPCDSGPADGVCVIVPSNVNQPPSGSTHDFTLTCGGGTCTGQVIWGESHAGDIVAFLTSGQQTGATANAITYSSSDEISGTTTLTATVGYPDNMVCNATITLQVPDIPENGGGEDHCTCIIDPSTGYPGSEHDLTAMCHYDGESDYCSSVSWSITSGDDFVDEFYDSGTWWSWLKTKNNIISGDEETISIRASTDAGDCYCHLPLPPMDCLDFL